MVLDPYKKWIEKLIPHTKNYLIRKGLDKKLNEKEIDKIAKVLATLIILGYEYGEGDAWAGYILLKGLNHKTMEVLNKILEKLGAKNLPATYMTSNLYAFFLLEVDYDDEEFNNIIKQIKTKEFFK